MAGDCSLGLMGLKAPTVLGPLWHASFCVTNAARCICDAVFLSLPPLVGGGDGLVCESVGKADLLSDHFDGKQSRESADLPLTCHPSSRLTSFPSGRMRSGLVHTREAQCRIVRFFPPLYVAQTQVCPDVQFCANIVALLAQSCRRRLRSFQPL